MCGHLSGASFCSRRGRDRLIARVSGGDIALQANTSGARGPEPGRIGAPLEELRQHLIRYGDVLTELVEPSARALVENASLHLKQLTCRIAVVGQIKSGKSSFINAFVQQPDFLPTSVTPWTTAVTNLHFGQRAPGEHAAIFTFLHGNEWRELAESGGRIRELTKQLVPGFEPELLHRQADLLRTRAQQRLGAEFESLARAGALLYASRARHPADVPLLRRLRGANGSDTDRQIFRYHAQRGHLLRRVDRSRFRAPSSTRLGRTIPSSFATRSRGAASARRTSTSSC